MALGMASTTSPSIDSLSSLAKKLAPFFCVCLGLRCCHDAVLKKRRCEPFSRIVILLVFSGVDLFGLRDSTPVRQNIGPFGGDGDGVLKMGRG